MLTAQNIGAVWSTGEQGHEAWKEERRDGEKGGKESVCQGGRTMTRFWGESLKVPLPGNSTQGTETRLGQ